MQKVTDILAERIRRFRESRKWSAMELAEKARIHPVYLSKLENSKVKQVSLDVVHRLAVALDVTIDDLASNKILYPEHDQKILELREQFEKYGYDSFNTVMEMIPVLSKEKQSDHNTVRSSEKKKGTRRKKTA